MRIVFFVHYFPPLNSTGARRVLALSKYFARFGHEVTVLTTKKSSFDGHLTEAIPSYCRVIELGKGKLAPTQVSHSARKGGGRPPVARALVSLRRGLTHLFGQLIDHRVFFALQFLSKKLPMEVQEVLSDADVFVSSNPPWPVHLAAYFSARRFGKPWVADYRDQFSGYHFSSGNFLSQKIEVWLERMLLRTARAVTVISRPMEEYYRNFHDRVVTIENGYDEELFDAARAGTQGAGSSQDCVIRYMGTITVDRIPRNFFASLRLLSPEERARVSVEFYGQNKLLHNIIHAEYADLLDLIHLKGEVPYAESLRLMLTADALFFIETSSGESLSTKGVLTTKLFEYLAAEKPIIADISPQTLIGNVIQQSGLGIVCSVNSMELKEAVVGLLAHRYVLTPNKEFITTFSRAEQAKRFLQVLESL